jgi:geranyl diphosphate 2-C-methyltransferase
MDATEVTALNLTEYERGVARMYDDKRDDINYLLGRTTQLIHHHFGIGDVEPGAMESMSPDAIIDRLHQLENDQVRWIIDARGRVQPNDRIFDGGSGRGGTALMLHEAFDCYYDGVTISSYQRDFSQQLARLRGCDAKVSFHLQNMLRTRFLDAHFQYLVTNETTMYIQDLHELYREFGRILEPGGRYVFATWCVNEACPDIRRYIDPIDDHYLCTMHTRSGYFRALLDSGFVPYTVTDLTAKAVPYWQLRVRSGHRTGIEQPFIDGYQAGAITYMIVGVQRVAGSAQ